MEAEWALEKEIITPDEQVVLEEASMAALTVLEVLDLLTPEAVEVELEVMDIGDQMVEELEVQELLFLEWLLLTTLVLQLVHLP